MTRNLRGPLAVMLVWLGVLTLTPTVQAGGIDDFQLIRAIPADAALVAHSRKHDGQAFYNEQMERVWQAVEQQHFEKDIRTLMKGLVQQNEGDPAEFDQQWQQFNDLLLAVEWSSLFEREGAFAMKMSFPAPELIMLGLASPEKAKANFVGLEKILKELIALAPEGELVFNTQGEGDSVVHTIGFANAPIPVGDLMLARQKDVLLLGFGQTMPEQALALLRGEAGQTLAETERFKAAFKQLPPPSDEAFFMDMTRFMGQLRAYVEAGMSMSDPTGEALEPKIKELPGKIFEAIELFDYIAASSTTNDLKNTEDVIAVLSDNAQSKPLYKVFFSNGTLKKPLKFIPQEAQNCMAWSGVNLKSLYDVIIAFIGDAVPDGEGLLAQWEEIKPTLPVDIENDILSWVGGEISYFALPAKSAYQPGPWALMISVTDEVKAREMLTRGFEQLEPMLAQSNGALRDAKIEGADGFKVVVMPMLAMVPGLGSPTLGIQGGQLFFGSSPMAISAALETASGKTPDFSSNERFVKEGIPRQG